MTEGGRAAEENMGKIFSKKIKRIKAEPEYRDQICSDVLLQTFCLKVNHLKEHYFQSKINMVEKEVEE